MTFTIDSELIQNNEVTITEDANGELAIEHRTTGRVVTIDEDVSISDIARNTLEQDLDANNNSITNASSISTEEARTTGDDTVSTFWGTAGDYIPIATYPFGGRFATTATTYQDMVDSEQRIFVDSISAITNVGVNLAISITGQIIAPTGETGSIRARNHPNTEIQATDSTQIKSSEIIDIESDADLTAPEIKTSGGESEFRYVNIRFWRKIQ